MRARVACDAELRLEVDGHLVSQVGCELICPCAPEPLNEKGLLLHVTQWRKRQLVKGGKALR